SRDWSSDVCSSDRSCMAQGQCSDGGPREPTGTPLSVIEAPEIHLMMQPVMAYALGAKRAMYYTVTKRLRTAWEPGGQWNEGGNGDGTATYIHAGKPAASVRLKNWRYGQNTVEYLRALGRDGKDLVRSPKDWNKEHGPLDALRVELARKLGAL